MQPLLDAFAGNLNRLGAEPMSIAVLVAGTILLLGMLLARGMRTSESVRRRANVTTADLSREMGQSRNALGYQADQRAQRFIAMASKLLAPTDQAALSQVRKSLINAGYFSASAVSTFYALRILLALALPTLTVLIVTLLPFQTPLAISLVIAAALAVIGLILPPVLLDRRRAKMRQLYLKIFPDFMDLMVVCVEAGNSVQAAIDRVGTELVQSCPQFGANLHLLSLELRAGRTLDDALRGLSERLGIDEVNSLCVLLKQSMELGTSLATTLRVYSDEMRDKRLMRAEAKAQALPVKMVLPLGLFIFPVILLVIMVPLVIRITTAFV